MKKLILSLLLFSSIIFSQNNKINYPNFQSFTKNGNPTLNVPTPLKSATELDMKISPYINLIMNNVTFHKDGRYEVSERIAEIKNIFEYHEVSKSELYLSVLLKSSNISETEDAIESNGGSVRSVIKNIVTADIPVSQLYKTAFDESVDYMDISSVRKMKLDVSKSEIRADLVETNLGINGSGVVAGILDSGIDWTHPVFSNSSGTRIQYLWDQSGSNNHPSEYSYGTEYTKSQIDAGNCSEVDGNDGHGHGSHVSSTVAGFDSYSNKYHGIAPGADIVFVKGFRNGPGFADNDVVDGCNYIFQKAQSMGKPCVINLSLGGHYGAHDGTSLYEQALSNMTGAGKIIVAAAGNEGGDLIHAGYAATGSDISGAQQTLMLANQGASVMYVDIWYQTGNISFGLVAYDQQGNMIGYTDAVTPGQSVSNQPFTAGGTTYGYYTIDATTTSDPNNGAHRVVYALDNHNGSYDLSTVYWGIYMYGSGTFDAWAVTGGHFSDYEDLSSGFHAGNNDKSVGMPSTAQKVICVGSYMTKKCWTSADGNQYCYSSGELGDISSFSSRGPSRDGRTKPDISAPGQAIAAALSSFLTVGVGAEESNILPGNKFQIMQGTSMATPHITGVVALMLQKNPNLDYASALSALTSTARSDSHTGSSLPNNIFGAGKVDAYSAVQAVGSGGGGGTETVLDEHFDGSQFPPSGWNQSVTNSSYTWTQGNPSEHPFTTIDPTNVNSAICPWVAQDQNEWLITPALQLPTSSQIDMDFWVGHSTNWLTAATIKLYISNDGGSNWTNLWQAVDDGQGWQWREINLDLSGWAGSTVVLTWQYVGNDGDLVGLDNIKIVSSTTGVNDENNLPTAFELKQNYPNPFNPATVIEYSVPSVKSGSSSYNHVILTVFDILGRKVATLVDKSQSPGKYKVNFDASLLPTGVYFYTLQNKQFRVTKKMLLLK
jgi:minor extracellular serine protease Vpr